MTAAATGAAFLKTSAAKNLLRSKFLGYAALLTLISAIFVASGLRWSIAASNQGAQLLSPYFPVCQSSSTFAPPCGDKELARRFFVGGIKENQSAWCDSQSSSEASCLVPPPRGYKKPVPWPGSLRKVRGSHNLHFIRNQATTISLPVASFILVLESPCYGSTVPLTLVSHPCIRVCTLPRTCVRRERNHHVIMK